MVQLCWFDHEMSKVVDEKEGRMAKVICKSLLSQDERHGCGNRIHIALRPQVLNLELMVPSTCFEVHAGAFHSRISAAARIPAM